jgi:hypothetical protein
MLFEGAVLQGIAPSRPPAGSSPQVQGSDPPIGIRVIRPSDTTSKGLRILAGTPQRPIVGAAAITDASGYL